jgi:DNA repair exonuclease SbcCD ATPase subunit
MLGTYPSKGTSMTDREALKLALEQVEVAVEYIDYLGGESAMYRAALAGLKKALAQPEQPTLQDQLDEAYADMAQANADKEKASADCEKAYNEAKRIEKLIEEKNT